MLVVTLIVGISLVYLYVSKSTVASASNEGGPQHSTAVAGDSGETILQLQLEDERAIYRRLLHQGGQVLQKDLRHIVPFSGPNITRGPAREEGARSKGEAGDDQPHPPAARRYLRGAMRGNIAKLFSDS